MAASSPSLSSNGPASAATPPKTLRGLNKPKCIQCGNVARSRCPYQSCKGCCSRAENPCPIHVLKANSSLPEKTPSQNTPASDQKSAEPSSMGNSHRVSSLRQLSSNFAQFNNLTIPLRSKKPLTRKDALALNEWRFSKLKEYNDRDIEVGNEAFDRYMLNVSLLEEVFALTHSHEENADPSSEQNDAGNGVSGPNVKLRSNSARTENLRDRVRQIVDEGLEKLRKCELHDSINDPGDEGELGYKAKRAKREERASALSDLIDRLNKARNNDDLRSCLEMKSKLYDKPAISDKKETEYVEMSSDLSTKNEPETKKDSDCSSPKSVRTAGIGEEMLKRIDEHFSSLEQIEDL